MFALCNSKDSTKQYQGKQNRYNNISAFDLFDKWESDEEQSQSDQKLDGGKAAESWHSYRLHTFPHWSVFLLWRFRQLIGLYRLRHTMKDQSHADGSNKKADDAGRRIDSVRSDIAYHCVGIGKD